MSRSIANSNFVKLVMLCLFQIDNLAYAFTLRRTNRNNNAIVQNRLDQTNSEIGYFELSSKANR